MTRTGREPLAEGASDDIRKLRRELRSLRAQQTATDDRLRALESEVRALESRVTRVDVVVADGAYPMGGRGR